jgi:Holliday junction DNA helicase RuvA
MIHAVIGEIVYVGAQAVVIRTVGGVEFQLVVSSQTASRLSQLQGDARRQVRLLSWLQHKEDSMTLFGFTDEEERLLFAQLIKVNGIGPKQAMKILSAVQVRAFIRALDESDIGYLSKIPGLGQKTSQKLILALRNTIVLEPADKVEQGGTSSGSRLEKRYDDLVAALVDMGYDKRQVISILGKLIADNESLLKGKNQHDTEEFLFRNAIVSLG